MPWGFHKEPPELRFLRHFVACAGCGCLASSRDRGGRAAELKRRLRWWALFSRRDNGSVTSTPTAASTVLEAELRACRDRDGELTAIRMLRCRRPELSLAEADEFVGSLRRSPARVSCGTARACQWKTARSVSDDRTQMSAPSRATVRSWPAKTIGGAGPVLGLRGRSGCARARAGAEQGLRVVVAAGRCGVRLLRGAGSGRCW